jgi:hypothetical protein
MYTLKIGIERGFVGPSYFRTNNQYPLSIDAKDDVDALKKAVNMANSIGHVILGKPGVDYVNITLLDIHNGKDSLNQGRVMKENLFSDSNFKKLSSNISFRDNRLEMNYSLEKQVRLTSKFY